MLRGSLMPSGCCPWLQFLPYDYPHTCDHAPSPQVRTGVHTDTGVVNPERACCCCARKLSRCL